MEIEFDPAKNAANIKKHGLSLEMAVGMEWDTAFIERDNRFHYDEIRFNAIVPLENRLYFVTFAERGETVRLISLRHATNTERTRYVKEFR
jgi:uncharacterized DUF497 family protein